VNEWLSALLQAVQDVDPVLRTTIAGVGMMLETSVFVGLVVPGDTIAIVASTAVEGWVEYFSLVAVIIAGVSPSAGSSGPKFATPESASGSVKTSGFEHSCTLIAAEEWPYSSQGFCRCCTRSSPSPWV
jgi:hypothetical protein